MRFPLADWIETHRQVRHNLAESGMHGELGPLPRGRPRPGPEVLPALRAELARSVGVAPERVFLTHGATEANAWTVFHVRRTLRRARPSCRVCLPEYPPLYDTPRSAGFRLSGVAGTADLAVISQPRNPEGDLWPTGRLLGWADGARHLLVDETFREFSGTPSLARRAVRGLWTSGSFTKFYGADELRVGFLIAPPEEVEGFGRLAGLVLDDLPWTSAEAAVALLHRRDEVRRRVRRVLERNVAHLRRAEPERPVPAAPVYFDRSAPSTERLARRFLDASVLVCPGQLFGDRQGSRVCLTRRSFPEDLDAYLRVREGRQDRGLREPRPRRAVRPRPAGAARGRAGRTSAEREAPGDPRVRRGAP